MKKVVVVVFVTLLAGCKEKEDDAITLLENQIELAVGDSTELKFTITPAGSANKDIYWNSSDPNTVYVKNGVIKARRLGQATITVTFYESRASSSCIVKVVPKRVEGVEISDTEIDIFVDDSYYISHTIIPSASTNRNVTWNSSDSDIASVNTNGLVTAYNVGVCTVTVKTEDGGFEASCVVNVKPVQVTGIAIKSSDDSDYSQVFYKNLFTGESMIIQYLIYPINATNKEVAFESSNDEVASIEYIEYQYYPRIVAKKAGNAEITATTVDGNHKATCVLTVRDIDIVEFATVRLAVGTEGNNTTGFYSVACAIFKISQFPTNSVNLIEIRIFPTTPDGVTVFIYPYSSLEYYSMWDEYRTPKIITAYGLQTYPAIGWKVEAEFEWMGKEYIISSIKQ